MAFSSCRSGTAASFCQSEDSLRVIPTSGKVLSLVLCLPPWRLEFPGLLTFNQHLTRALFGVQFDFNSVVDHLFMGSNFPRLLTILLTLPKTPPQSLPFRPKALSVTQRKHCKHMILKRLGNRCSIHLSYGAWMTSFSHIHFTDWGIEPLTIFPIVMVKTVDGISFRKRRPSVPSQGVPSPTSDVYILVTIAGEILCPRVTWLSSVTGGQQPNGGSVASIRCFQRLRQPMGITDSCYFRVLLAVGFGLPLVACGGGNSTSTPPAQITIQLNQTSVSILADAQQQFTAVVQGTSNTAVTWTVDAIAGGNSTVGTITASGMIPPPLNRETTR